MGASDFFHVPAEPRQCTNSAPYLAAHGKCTRSRRLNQPKSSLDGLLGPRQVLVPFLERCVLTQTRSGAPELLQLRSTSATRAEDLFTYCVSGRARGRR